MHISELMLVLAEAENLDAVFKKIRTEAAQSSVAVFSEDELSSRAAQILRSKGYKVDWNRYTSVWTVSGWDA